MLRWCGALLIFCGALLTRYALLESDRHTRRTRCELADALEEMEAAVRALLTPIPSLLRQSYGEYADAYFARVLHGLSKGESLRDAWRKETEGLALPPEERAAVAELGRRLNGDEEMVCAALRSTAALLRRRYERDERQRANKERITTWTCISISLFLVIMLL